MDPQSIICKVNKWHCEEDSTWAAELIEEESVLKQSGLKQIEWMRIELKGKERSEQQGDAREGDARKEKEESWERATREEWRGEQCLEGGWRRTVVFHFSLSHANFVSFDLYFLTIFLLNSSIHLP